MSIDALVMDVDAISLLGASLDPDEDWFKTFATFDPQGRIQSDQVDRTAIIRSKNASASSNLLIVRLEDPSFFARFPLPHAREVLRRILIVGLTSLTKGVTIPRAWAPFNVQSKVSFRALPLTAQRLNSEVTIRIEADRNPFGTSNIYVYGCRFGHSELSASVPERATFDKARKAFLKSLDSEFSAESSKSDQTAIQLSDETFYGQEAQLGFGEWYKARLSIRQRDFVDSDLTSPIRLRGAAGTGKTLALAVKLLFAAKARLAEGKSTRILFLTHSVATSHATAALLASLDNEGIAGQLEAKQGYSLTVATLLDLAMDAVGSDLAADGVLPLATDALEGRQLQLELIESVIEDYAATKDWALLRGMASDHIKELIATPRGSASLRRFAWEVMTEFACVLDADGVQAKPDLRKRYLGSNRQAWMMPLASEADRRVMLALYDRFNEQIRSMNAISVDQIISDFLNYLDSFRWNAVRDKRGSDLIFVDELHLFNRQERMVLHGLTRIPTESPGLFMAYDAKQAPSDTFMPSDARETSSTFWGRLKVGGIQKVELDQVFRYTPQIAAFIAALDQSFPALDLGDEWGAYDVSSQVRDAAIPSLTEAKDSTDLYTKVMQRAHSLKRKGGERFSLAVLCCNPDTFDTFRNAGVFKKNFVSIASRDEAADAKVDAFRFVLSTPEYVAGLQFDCVMLLDVNRSEVLEGPYSASARRKFISTLYLGASRAKRHLELYCTTLDGGRASVVENAIEKRALLKCAWSQLADVNDVATIPKGLAAALG